MANVEPQVLEVYVLDGVVTPPNPRIPNQGILVLVNQDLVFYRVQLWNDSDDDHPPIYGVLPPLGQLVLMGGPDAGDQNTHCNFELFETDMSKPAPGRPGYPTGTGPGHTITIGSGGVVKKSRKNGKR